MTDKKILTTIIKRLDRVIALLDGCYDTGEMSESSRRRLVEMLHTSITDIYSVGKKEDTVSEVNTSEVSDNQYQEEVIEEVIAEVEQEELGVVENNNEIDTEEDAVEAIAEEKENDFVAEQIVEQEEPVVEPVAEEIEEIELGKQSGYDTLIELESHASLDDFVAEKIEDTLPPVVEQTAVQEEVPEIDIEAENKRIAKEKTQLTDLRNQLEMERMRLEEELLSFQKERIKREEEMKAAEKLLAALETETQKRNKANVANNADKNTVAPVAPPAAPVTLPAEPKKATATAPKATIGDTLTEKRQFVHESFNSNELKMQGVTPIPDLTKAIGINDKFQFIKELFGGDSDHYTDTIRTLNNFNTVEEAFNHIETYFITWDKNNDAVKRIILLIRRRYM